MSEVSHLSTLVTTFGFFTLAGLADIRGRVGQSRWYSTFGWTFAVIYTVEVLVGGR